MEPANRILAITVAICLLCPVAVPQALPPSDLPPDVLLTSRVLYTNRKLIERLPLYTCLETITRSQPGKKKRAAQKQDVVQVDVGVGARDEMYSWPGDTSFSSKDLLGLVGHGLLATGLFHSFAQNIFAGNQGIVKTAGDAEIAGRKALRFTYTVPSLNGRWDVNWMGAEGVVGQRGEFWIDPSDLSLLQLDATAIDIPSSLPLLSLQARTRYRAQGKGEEQVLLPQGADLEAVDLKRVRYHDEVEFSHCHVFAAESNLSTTDNDLAQAVTRYEAQRQILPAGLILSVALDTAIHPKDAVVGNAVHAVLRQAVKLPGQPQSSIPAGALLKGHIREFGKMEEFPNTYVVGLEFDELTWPGHAAAFFAEMTSVQPLPGIEFMLADVHSQSLRTPDGLRYQATTMKTWARKIPGAASFFLQGAGASLPKGLYMTWRTEKLARP